MKKINRANQRLSEITPNTLIVGVDIAKNEHRARFVDFRGIEHGKAIKFKNGIDGFTTIVSEINKLCKKITSWVFEKYDGLDFDEIIATKTAE